MHQFEIVPEHRWQAYSPRVHPPLDWILDPPLIDMPVVNIGNAQNLATAA